MTTSSGGIIAKLRSFKIGPFAVFDFAMVALVAKPLAKHINEPVSTTFAVLLVLGICVHFILGIKTPLNTMIFGVRRSI